ncbi:TIR domain-containing protein [candidate division KSB3 bacterium]|uniref:TIR domain-containing protein n=1 Tax=candidate division KSB3 bacterium TaxID=2044937 RepID=A0A9D5JX35_9BACT|nr:TIR domain-containing protein [candidate division KSB3 bacterium]
MYPGQKPKGGNMAQETSETGRYNAFLSHNSQDKPQVEWLARWLQAQGLRVWYDEWELRPGVPWQEKLEEGISNSHAVVICLGPSGFGPWHKPEMRAALAKGASQGSSVIPVLLPGCPETPELPLFLEAYTWVDFRNGLEDEQARQKLLWGITGKHPERGEDVTPPPPPKQIKRKRLLAVAFSIAIVLIILTTLMFLLAPPQSMPLAGTILDQQGEPLPGVVVTIVEFDVTTETDSQGKFSVEIETEEQRTVRLMAQKEGFATYRQDATLGNTGLTFKMKPMP